MIKNTIIQILLLAIVMVTSCTARGEIIPSDMANQDNRTRVKLETSLGDIVVILYNETPQHRDNFIKLTKEGFYDGVLFHRVIKDFMVQTGDPDSRNATADSQLGAGDPGYTLPAEFVYPKHFHKRGALAAARTGDQINPERRSSGSQFYIVTGRVYNAAELASFERRLTDGAKQDYWNKLCDEHKDDIMKAQNANDTTALNTLHTTLVSQLEDHFSKNPVAFTQQQKDTYTTVGGTPFLDNQYTVFGEVVEGMDIVDRLQRVATNSADRPVTDVKIIKATVIE